MAIVNEKPAYRFLFVRRFKNLSTKRNLLANIKTKWKIRRFYQKTKNKGNEVVRSFAQNLKPIK